MPQFLKDYGERLVELGYTVLPIRPGTKRPDLKNWPNHATTTDDVRAWYSNGRAAHGAGINARNTPAIDVDVMDKEIADAMSDAIDRIFPGVTLMTRTGLAPKFLIPFRSDEPFRKLTSHVYTDGKHEHKVEILGSGQQWVAYHVHPDTERPYQWFDGFSDVGIVEVERVSLPLLDAATAQRVIDAFEVLAAGKVAGGGWRAVTRTPDASARADQAQVDPFAGHESPVIDLTREQTEWVVSRIANDEADYDRWFSVLCAIHAQLGEEGLELARSWSAKSSKHIDETLEAKYASLGRYTGPKTSIRSLLKETGQPPKEKPTPGTDKAFAFHSGDDYATDFIGGPEIVEDVFPVRGLAMVYGPSGKGKTFWMLDLAFHVHNGARWRDKDVAQGDVMYIAAEAGRGIKKRIHAVKLLHPEWCAPFIADAAPNLSELTSIEAVRDAARAAGSPSMVIIDTMSASFEGDDSSQKDVAQMIRNLKILADDLQCLVVFVHHTTKEGGSFRGSGVLFNDVDAVLELDSTGEGAERRQWVKQLKHREGEDGKSYPFSLKISEPLAFKPNGRPVTSCTVEQEDYTPPAKVPKKSRGGAFETSENYATARHFLSIIQDEVGLSEANIEEEAIIAAIQKDEKDKGSGFEDHPPASNIKRTLLTLGKLGKIRKEGRWIRLC